MRVVFDIIGILFIAVGALFAAGIVCNVFDINPGTFGSYATFFGVGCIAGIPCGLIAARWSEI